MVVLRTIELLHEISARCLANEPLDHVHLQWLGQALSDYLTRRSPSIDAAMQLRSDRGGIPWWRERANRKRDAALRELANRHLTALSLTAKAQRIKTLGFRYAATGWRFDRMRKTMPPDYVGTPNEWLWLAFSSGASMPISERQLRKILGG